IAEGSRSGRYHWIYPRYFLGRIAPQETRSVTEDRLLTGGGYYREPDIYRRVLEDAVKNGNVDPSMSYDIGAELNAVAVTLLFSKQGRYRSAPAREDRKSTRLNSSHRTISYAVFCLKKKN